MQPETKPTATPEQQEELRFLRFVILELMGNEEGEAFLQSSEQRAALLAMAPQTFMAQISAKVQSIYAGMTEEELERRSVRIYPILLEYQQRKRQIKLKEIRNHTHPGPQAVLSFLQTAASSPRYEAIKAELRPRLDVDMSVLGGNPAGGMILSLQTGIEVPFETRATALANSFVSIAEKLYRPILISLLRVTHLIDGIQRQEPSDDSIGSVIHKCREAWKVKYTALLTLLEDRARILRNSQGHCATTIDVGNETITFVNKNATPFGPLAIEEFAKFYLDFVQFNFAVLDAIRLELNE